MMLALFLIVGFASADEPPKFDVEWKQCETGLECLVIRGSCDEPECVNAHFSQKASGYYEAIAGSVDCQSSGREQNATAACDDHLCQCHPLKNGD